MQTQRGPWWRRILPVAALLLVGSYVAVIALVVVFEGRLIFLPPKVVTPNSVAEMGVSYEDLRIPVDGKGFVHAWWIPAANAGAKTILYFHGNAERLEQEADAEAPLFHRTGANLLLVDYRGYGTSSPLNASGHTTAEDALASLRYLTQQRHIPAKNIAICGRSIGTGVAAQLAIDSPSAGGLILVSPITSVIDVSDEDPVFRYVLRPVRWFRHDNDFDTRRKMGSIRMPVLIMTGTRDTLAPPRMAEELYARAAGPRTIRLLPGAGHNDILQSNGDEMVQSMTEFLQTLPTDGGAD